MKDSARHAVNPLRNSPVLVSGLHQSGKTTFICALIRLAEKLKLEVGAIKPFDAGLLKKNAEEQISDGEIFIKEMQGNPTLSLVAPYSANEDYPLEMALRRDGTKIEWTKILQRLNALGKQYDHTFIELPSSLFTPLDEQKQMYNHLNELGKTIVFVIHPLQEQFTQNLAEINLLNQLDIQVHYVLNNASKIQDQDLLFYIWEKLESVTQQTMAGMMPFDDNVSESYERLGDKIEDNLPALVDILFR